MFISLNFSKIYKVFNSKIKTRKSVNKIRHLTTSRNDKYYE